VRIRRTMPQVVLPSRTLPDPHPSPLILVGQSICGQVSYQRLGEDDMAVLEFVV
jgi:hypothetical protein